ncbi:MAG: 3-deoxy-manno-octulosonate cytidylyltransferase [Chlorobi bacterium]|nr:3-deoxy-manno-octulosonate cytidylyltransferase [Chlorobiota bacterium]
MNILAIIPSRYASTRFPGKPLVMINGKTMIRNVYERVSKIVDNVIIATDDYRIENEAKSFNANYVMTSTEHKSGTDRCAEALLIYEKQTNKKFDAVINIQGDEPFIESEHIEKVLNVIKQKQTQIASLVKEINNNEDVFNPDKPKVIINKNNNAIYFSRSPIPYIRDTKKEEWHLKNKFFKHIGIYAYKSNILLEITKLQQSILEKAESLEQNRWIENGYTITIDYTKRESLSIDTEEDLKKALNF